MKLFLSGVCFLLLFGFASLGLAFHSGGVADCAGCHGMHSSKGPNLLVGTDPSSTCLNCHMSAGDVSPGVNSYHISTVDGSLGPNQFPLQRGPGGDFGWLKKSYQTTYMNEPGERHGHNIVASDFGYLPDIAKPVSPGGSFISLNLSCISCHDPHSKWRRQGDGTFADTGIPISGSGSSGNIPGVGTTPAGTAVGVYRLLAGPGYGSGKSNHAGASFTGSPASAVSPTYQQSEAANQLKVAYGAGFSQWCATCHADMHSNNGSKHPVGQTISSEILSNYNAYKKTGDLTGTQASSFLSLVPYEEETNDTATLKLRASIAGVAGPMTGAKVTCVTCHRAHASGFPEIGRWEFEYEFITKNGSYLGGTTREGRGRAAGGAEYQAAYYDRPPTVFSTYQRSLCNKCHVKD